MAEAPETVVRWHEVFDHRADPEAARPLLDALLADDAVFRSPAVHAPQEGKALATAYLSAAMVVLGPTLRYERELYSDDSAVLEFRADLDGVEVHGIDFMRWDAEGRIVDFTVMLRPFKALTTVIEKMGAELTR